MKYDLFEEKFATPWYSSINALFCQTNWVLFLNPRK